MVKNIIFDLGNVLVEFNVDKMIHHFFSSRQEEIKTFFFADLWDKYDQGLYSKEEMIEMGIEQFPELKEEIICLMENWTQFVVPIHDNVEYLKTLKTLGYNVYILSNIPEDDTLYLKSLKVFDSIDGGVFSYQVKMIKPDKKIYEYLLSTYHLCAKECLFLDDRKENIETAKKLGFHIAHIENVDEVIKKVEDVIREV